MQYRLRTAIACCILFFLFVRQIQAQTSTLEGFERIAYKHISDTILYLHILQPESGNDVERPAIVFFFGGGWKGGSVHQFKPHAEYFARHGVVTFLADYRVESRQGTTPFDAVEDAKSAVRYLRKYATKWKINPKKIIAAGGSAGGHIAAAAGTVPGLDSDKEDISISSVPNALVLFNPVYDNGPDGYGYDRIGERYLEISPIHNIDSKSPPTIIFFGTEDPLVPVITSEKYLEKMRMVGVRCDLFLYPGQKHGFFNHRQIKYYNETVYQTHLFLQSLNLVNSTPDEADGKVILQQAHAHNDYRHENPLQDAIRQGFCSVEADILFENNYLFVGHDREELLTGHLGNLEDLYLKPLFSRFKEYGSIYPQIKSTPFYLWIDIKYQGKKVFRKLRDVLKKYRPMLISRNNEGLQDGAVQIILSGDRPFKLINKRGNEHMFVDGRPKNLTSSDKIDRMPFVSANIEDIVGKIDSGKVNLTQQQTLEDFVDRAHSLGYKVRFWNTPDHESAWRQLLELEVDLINTDELQQLRSFLISVE